MRFRPSAIPTLAMIVAVAILMSLGVWQLRRHVAQTARLQDIDAKLHAPSLVANDLGQDPEILAWHHATLTGTLQGPSQLIAGVYAFGRPGYRLIQTLHTQNRALLVDRGWIPSDQADAIIAQQAKPEEVTIQGLLLPIKPDIVELMPDTQKVKDAVLWPQQRGRWLGFVPRLLGPPWQAMANQAGDVLDIYLVMGPERKNGQSLTRTEPPISGYIARPKQITHFSYAMQWFLIGMTAIGVWVYAGILRGREPAVKP